MIKIARRVLIACATFSASVAGIAVIYPSSAEAQVSRCDQIQDRARRQRCRSAEYDAQRYREEQRTWRQAEDDIRRQHRNGCRAAGAVGRRAGIGGIVRGACEAPRIIYDERERRRGR